MKQLYNLLLILTTVFFFACQEDDEMSSLSGKGYLRLQVGQNAELTTKADEYNSERIAVYIKDSENKIVKQTTDFEAEWKDTEIELSPGEYTIEAESYGWDGEAGEDKAYYKGSNTVTIEKDKSVDAEVVCYLANVKVTVAFEQDFLTALGDGTITVQVQNVNGQTTYKAMDFNKSSEKQVAYFAATDIDVKYTVTTDKGKNEGTREIREVKAKDHYILNFRLAQQGAENVTVKVDPTMTLYEYTFNVSPEAKNTALLSANAWAKLAYLKAENISATTGTDVSTLKFQYRVEGAGSWTDAAATKTTVEATEEGAESTEVYNSDAITGLTSNTTYEYRMVNEDETFESSTYTFKTEEELQLQNAGFEDWYLLEAKLGFMGADSKTWYPCSQSYYTDNGASFWDSSNPGTTQGMGSMSGGLNPTQGTSEVKHGGTKAAKLETQWAVLKLAAASIYTGKFNSLVGTSGAKIDFGQPFVSRPTSLTGWYQYAPEVIDNESQEVGKSGILKKGDTDQCSIYIILATSTHQVDNTNTSTLLTAENVWNDNTGKFIAYGELPADQCVDTKGEWKEFNIPLQYKEGMFGVQPTHLIIVSSSSKYGDYFTGAVGSTLYLDDFSLNYEGTPAIWNFESGAAEE